MLHKGPQLVLRLPRLPLCISITAVLRVVAVWGTFAIRHDLGRGIEHWSAVRLPRLPL